jgi:deoxyribonuclease-4
MSIAGGVHRAIERGLSIGCQTVQIFLKSNLQWRGPAYTEEQVRVFRQLHAASRLGPVFAHSCYLINLASPQARTYERSLRATVDEVRRATQLDVPFIIMHPGAQLGQGESAGLRRVARALRETLTETRGSSVKIALETTAGQGSNLGYRFEHLAELISHADLNARLAVCVDTCHLFAAGYDIRTATGCEEVFAEFDCVVGLDRLVAIHLNDSKGALGSRLDRHEHIGKGKIGRAAFRWLVNDPRLKRVPMVLETPKGNDMAEDVRNLQLLRRFIRK